MQRLFVQRLATLSLTGLLSAIAVCTSAQALPEEDVIKKLDSVPVFTIVDPKGNPLIITVKDKDKKDTSILPLFLDQKAVQDAYGNFQKNNAQAAKNSQIGVISLGQAFKAVRDEQKKKDNKVAFQFLTDPKTVDYALEISKKSDANIKSFPGIPVFYAMGSDDKTKAKGFVTFEKDGKQYVPLFFDQKDLERNVNEIKRSKPELAKQMNIEVASLDSVVSTMLEGKNDAEFTKLTFVPSLQAVQYVQTLQKNAKAQAGPAPAPAPASAPAPSTPPK
ncbi:Tic22 family protein [Gloeobacter kilaueensis]|uniref:Tic22 family protein n=1 Tax=Gloeobacter kilaueensis (strain ATCC BAA-2537 / CCAP 1431/1 / ULC 316 / JS1) TaxID=1183438 RepID=U5QEU0_GLOK1|nr:Tic22 family protein [Gloeobacter kilaueensis]AGY57472.1 hypothetical protein GKIL_1226 [Gloeobacter kilaueensis JS1]